MPLVSVIIPTYNCERYIAETIHGVLNQTFKDVELIVVDDGSTDRTRDIVASYGPAIRLITQKNARVCAARNRGIREAAGQYVCLLDHDDYWFPHKLELQVSLLAANPDSGVVYSTFILWHPDASGLYPALGSFDLGAYPDSIDPDYSGWIYHQFLLDCWMLTSTAMFRREVFDRCGVFDVDLPYSEDWDLWLRISREYQFLRHNTPTTLYRQHPGQGNRQARSIDYRTLLLERAARRWGLCSHDGRCVTRAAFNEQLALYHQEFGLGHLRAGNTRVAVKALFKAWRKDPSRIRNLAYIPAGLLGWRPNW
jgi:glycosyltransferase involved in cell wall biosynthesis